ncbi:telomere-associated protein RIF1 [Syngnathoides biaculeatus]|uniref:telomere-associated protein RIF1 n=1 Tax=Syngnathoides biaculeatus TaxID=300417 RepID=UPI002ADD50CA|nr:telomere-associated protein RIF1 [Syngnathoides biaculeatus]
MMASAEPPSSFSIVPLLECLEDSTAGRSEQTDAYLTIANRLSGDKGRQFLLVVTKHFSRLGSAILTHVSSPHAELSQAALQALGFCVYHSDVVSGVSETLNTEILSALCSVVSKCVEKNTCTRALWVISKQSFPANMVDKKVGSILSTLERVLSKGEVQSVFMEHEAINVIIRLLEQVPAQMGEWAVCWAKLVIPLVVHSTSKVRLRAAAAMEMGLPLLLQKQMEVAAIIEPLMSTKLIPELQKLFMSKNEMNVLKLWPLFVKLLGKLLHRGGPFINSLLHLEELGFRCSSPTVKKIAFIAWKSLIDNFALNPDILCSAKRMKLLMQPLVSINIRTEALLLTKVEVWWYLVVQLGPNLSPHFDLVSLPLLQCTIGSEAASAPAHPARGQNGIAAPGTPKSTVPLSIKSLTPNSSLMNLNSSMQLPSSFPSIQLLGLEMLLHYFLGPEVVAAATKNKLVLTLEPLTHPLLNGASSFSKHAAVLISNIKDGFNNLGKEVPDALLALLWDHLVHFVSLTIETGSKKDRHGCEVLTLALQALKNMVYSESLPPDKVLILFESTVKGISPRVLGSASYQVGRMDVLNGTPALFLILLLFDSSMLTAYVEDARFYQCLQTLVSSSLSGPTSPLAFAEAVLGAVGRSAASVHKEHLLRIWSVVVAQLTDTIMQTNEVNQGDALEHNFNAMHVALMFPVTHLLGGWPQQQAAQKSMLSTWSKLYKVFARCSALVVTAEENVCCEELCVKMAATVDRNFLTVPLTLTAFASILQVMMECVDFSPYIPQFQQKLKSPHTPINWSRKRNRALGNLSTLQSLLVQCLDIYLAGEDIPSEATGMALLSALSLIFTNLVIANAVKETLTSLIPPLSSLYKQAASEQPRFTTAILSKMERLLGEVFCCIQNCSTLATDNELLALLSPLLSVLFPHKNKQHRKAVTYFWNSTFAKAVGLIYPAELRPVLSKVKQKTPIILPGFEAVSVADELSGQYSSESSQLETKLSGVIVASTGKRDSLLLKTAELSDQNSSRTKVVSTKLDFGSPKLPRREMLDEEASVDFVFIPPEAKERVLTEHQKEVKRTKRVDIPAMYNNLDASLDTTSFAQYTQSQEDSLRKIPIEVPDQISTEFPVENPQAPLSKEVAEFHTEATHNFASPKALENESSKEEQEIIPESSPKTFENMSVKEDQEIVPESRPKALENESSKEEQEIIPESRPRALENESAKKEHKIIPASIPEAFENESVKEKREVIPVSSPKTLENESAKGEQEIVPESNSVSMEEDAIKKGGVEDMDAQPEKNISPNRSCASDLISGTAQKSSGGSRRQSFITLEKYTEVKQMTPSTTSSFTGPLVKPSGSQDLNTPSSVTSLEPFDRNSQPSEQELSECPVNNLQESPQRPKMDSEWIVEPLRLTEKHTSNEKDDIDDDDDVIPDTQTEGVFMENTTLTYTSEDMRNSDREGSFQETMDVSQSSKILISSGERKHRKQAKHIFQGESPVDSSTPQNRPNTRSKVASEEDSGRIRLRSQRDRRHASQTKPPVRSHRKVKLYSRSGNFLHESENQRSIRAQESSQTDFLSESQRQSHSKRGRPRKSLPETSEDPTKLKKTSSQTDLKSVAQSDFENHSHQRHSWPTKSRKELKKPKTLSEAMGSQYHLKSDINSDFESHSRRKQGRPPKSLTNPKEELLKEQPEKLSSQVYIYPDTQADSEGNLQQKGSQDTSCLQDLKRVALKPDLSKKMPSQKDVNQLDSLVDSQQNSGRLSRSLLESKEEDLQMSEQKFSHTDTLKSDAQHDLPPKSLEDKEEEFMSPEIMSGKVSSKTDFQSDSRYDTVSQTQRRSSRISKSLSESEVIQTESMLSQTDTQSDTGSDTTSQTQRKRGRPSKLKQIMEGSHSHPQGLKKDGEPSQTAMLQLPDQIIKDEKMSVYENRSQSQEIEVIEHSEKEEKYPQTILTIDAVQDGISTPGCMFSKMEDTEKGEPETCQKSQEIMQNATESQSLQRRRRSKTFSEAAEDKTVPNVLSRKLSKSHSQEYSPAKTREDNRTRRRNLDSQCCPISTPENAQSLDVTVSTVSSHGRKLGRRSSKVLTGNTESLQSELSGAKQKSSLPAKRRNSQGTSSSLTCKSDKIDCIVTKKILTDSEMSEPSQLLDDSLKSQDSPVFEPLHKSDNSEERKIDVSTAGALEPFQEKPDPEIAKNQMSFSSLSSKKLDRKQICQTKTNSLSQDSDIRDLDLAEMSQSEGTIGEQSQKVSSSEAFAVGPQTPLEVADEKLQVSDSSPDWTTPTVVGLTEDCISVKEEETVVSVNKTLCSDSESSSVVDEHTKAAEISSANVEEKSHQFLEGLTPLHEGIKDKNVPLKECQNVERTHMSSTHDHPEATQSDVCTTESTRTTISQDSPTKLKDLEAELMPDMVQSPCNDRTKGNWSPSASPSTSILKKCQKRPLEEETPSPLIKLRRVSFANPIQQQEIADDIDRRSPAVRTSSPRRAKIGNLPQPKFVTTPTKGPLTISPRNLYSPNFKSSKKCLISEMSQEPRPVSKDCIYPALVGCAAPVDLILPQISSSIWSRGFGQLVRARNIKTVGDLSALTPKEIKTLPIHPPKISNVKKALKTFEQQRKGKGEDELKSFMEMEIMTSKPEETCATPEEKPGDMLATEFTSEPVLANLEEERGEATSELSVSGSPQSPLGNPGGLLARLDALHRAVTPPHLSSCSPQQLFNIHEHLSVLMRRVMYEMQSRLAHVNEHP